MKKEEENKPANNRRDFIKTSAIAAAGFMIVPRHVLGRGFVAPSDRLVVAGIGVVFLALSIQNERKENDKEKHYTTAFEEE